MAKSYPDNIALQLALAESLIVAGQDKAGLHALAQDHMLYPGSRAVSGAYARALLNANEAPKAVQILKPLMDANTPVFNPDLYRLLATAANTTGDKTLALRAMANAYALMGNYDGAIIQLRLVLRDPKLTPVQRAQIERHKKAIEDEHKKAKHLGLAK